jgi:hypothetical protein
VAYNSVSGKAWNGAFPFVKYYYFKIISEWMLEKEYPYITNSRKLRNGLEL